MGSTDPPSSEPPQLSGSAAPGPFAALLIRPLRSPACWVGLEPDFLKVLDPEKVINFEIENADSAALLTTDDGYGYVVMPLARDR